MIFRHSAADRSIDGPPLSALTRRACASALVMSVGIVLALVVLGSTVIAQTARRAQTPLQQAKRALFEGRYDEVGQIVSQLDARDPDVAVARAQAEMARGRYAEAEALLRPAATRAPASVAALELGLLMQLLRRPDARSL